MTGATNAPRRSACARRGACAEKQGPASRLGRGDATLPTVLRVECYFAFSRSHSNGLCTGSKRAPLRFEQSSIACAKTLLRADASAIGSSRFSICSKGAGSCNFFCVWRSVA